MRLPPPEAPRPHGLTPEAIRRMQDAIEYVQDCAGSIGSFSVYDVSALLAEVSALREALRWAIGSVTKPTKRYKQNADYCDAYDAAVRALSGRTPEGTGQRE